MLTRMLDVAARLDPVGRRVARGLRRADRVVDAAAGAVASALVLAVGVLVRLAQQHVLPPSARTAPAHAAAATAAAPPPRRVRQLGLACAAVFVAGLLAVTATAPPTAPAAAVTAAVAQPVPPVVEVPEVAAGPARPEARAMPPEPAPPHSLPAFEAPAPVAVAPEAPAPPRPPDPARWLPTGTGMWIHDWTSTEGGDGPRVVERAQAIGLSHLYVQTGSTKKGFIGDEVLSELLPATRGTDLKVIAWDFPKLLDPEADARRMAAAATWSRPGVPRVAAVAPDVETAAEGTRITPHAALRYYRELRRALPPDIAVLATVPWPSEKRRHSYPYAETAAHSDAFVPMAYWYNRAPGVVTATSMQWLAQFHKPVMPVGQGYDGRIDAPYLPEDADPAGSAQAFVDAARAGGAASISLWSWQTTGGPQWGVLTAAGALPWTPAVGVPVPGG